jgi:hypothetical protein
MFWPSAFAPAAAVLNTKADPRIALFEEPEIGADVSLETDAFAGKAANEVVTSAAAATKVIPLEARLNAMILFLFLVYLTSLEVRLQERVTTNQAGDTPTLT